MGNAFPIMLTTVMCSIHSASSLTQSPHPPNEMLNPRLDHQFEPAHIQLVLITDEPPSIHPQEVFGSQLPL